jgi:pimeloyl-ACP methyl ester carboxylesterase
MSGPPSHLAAGTIQQTRSGKVVTAPAWRSTRKSAWLRGKYPQPRYGYLRQRQASASYDATGRLRDIRVPALILHGRRDRSMPVDLAERMHAGIPGSRAELFRGGRMFFLFAERQQFLDQAGRFPCRATTQPAETQPTEPHPARGRSTFTLSAGDA